MKKMKAILFAMLFLAFGAVQTLSAQDKAAEEKKAEMKKEAIKKKEAKKKVNYDVDRMKAYVAKIAESRKQLALEKEKLAIAVKNGEVSEETAKSKKAELALKEERLNAMSVKAEKKMNEKPTSSKDRGRIKMKQKEKAKSKTKN